MTSTDVLNADLERLARSVDGTLIRDRDAGYDEARHVFNAMIERRPAAILRCASVSDAALGIKVAREYGLPLSIRGGGHSVAGNMNVIEVEGPLERVAVGQRRQQHQRTARCDSPKPG